MKLLFDLIATQPSPEARFHGGAEYAKTIFFEALKRGYGNFDCVYREDLHLERKIQNACQNNNITLIPVKGINEVVELIKTSNYSRFYSALPYEYASFDFDQTEFYMDVLGLRELEMPSDITALVYRNGLMAKFKLLVRTTFFKSRNFKKFKKKYFKLLNVRNKHILTISNHSKYSILSFFPHIKNEEISVAYAPMDFPTIKPSLMDGVNKENYFLLISANRWIKNNHRAIKALDSLFSEGKLEDKRVVVLGVSKKLSLKIENKDRFEFKDYVEKEELIDYYKKAFCFIYPSLNEGFGYPPLNAMIYGTPVLASSISAIPEVCQNAVLFFNPFSIPEIKNRILQVSNEKGIYKDLQQKGFQRIYEIKEMQESMLKDRLNRIFN